MSSATQLHAVVMTHRDGKRTRRTFGTQLEAHYFLWSIPLQQAAGELPDVASARIERLPMGLN